MDESIHELVAATLSKLGLPAPTTVIQTILLRDRYFVGHKFSYDGGHAIWLAGDDTIGFYDEQGTLLKVAALGTGQKAA
jgi:hypothetical protein